MKNLCNLKDDIFIYLHRRLCDLYEGVTIPYSQIYICLRLITPWINESVRFLIWDIAFENSDLYSNFKTFRTIEVDLY